jgi:N-methylhydantoinase A
LHANRLAAELQVPLVIIPPSPGTTSALGLLVTDLKHHFTRTRVMKAAFDPATVNAIFEPLERAGEETLLREGVARAAMRLQHEIEVRYVGQSHELAVPCDGGALTAEQLWDVVRRFHAEHQRTYGHSYPAEPVEAVSFRVTAVGLIAKPQPREWPTRNGSLEAARIDTRPVFFHEAGSFLTSPVFDRYGLASGDVIRGPAVIEEMDSTSLIHPGYRADVDTFGNLRLCHD